MLEIFIYLDNFKHIKKYIRLKKLTLYNYL